MKAHFSICCHIPQHTYLKILMESFSYFFGTNGSQTPFYVLYYPFYVHTLGYSYCVHVCRICSSSILRIIEQHHYCNIILIIIDVFIFFISLHIWRSHFLLFVHTDCLINYLFEMTLRTIISVLVLHKQVWIPLRYCAVFLSLKQYKHSLELGDIPCGGV